MDRKIRRFILAAFFSVYCLLFLGACYQKGSENELKYYVEQSQVYYQRSVDLYQDLIPKVKDATGLRLGLAKLYYDHGEFKKSADALRGLTAAQAKKLLALSQYRLGNFTDALEIFSKNELRDEESLYYYGLSCEKMNLFDRARDTYKKISAGKFASLSLERLNAIEKQTRPRKINELDPKMAQMIVSAPGLKQYPQAGALILLADEKVLITKEHTQLSEMHYVIKILNERGKENFSESHIDYDSTYEKVELEYARTIKPDGTVADVGARHIRDVSKYLNFPLYSNVRVYIISFPEIATGTVIDYKLKIYRNELINKKDFVLNYPVQSTEPIITAKFVLEIPRDKVVAFRLLNDKYNNFGAALKPNREDKDGRLIYSWHFKDIPQITLESNMPPQVEVNPTILISTFSSWKQIYDWWWELARDKIKPSAAIKQKVKQLISSQPSPEAKIRAIYNFCAKEIRYVAVEYGQAGFEPHQAEEVFKNKYGDCKDQAILLVTMLKEAGFTSSPVLISTKDYYDLNLDFPTVLFNHCIAAVSLNGKIVFVDPTAETCSFKDLPPGDQKRNVLVFKEDSYSIENTPLYPAGHNLLKQTLHIKINREEQIEAEKNIFTSGMYEQIERFWLLYTPPELIEDKLKETIQGISIGAQLKSYKIENLDNLNKLVVLNYKFFGPEYFTAAGKLRILPQLYELDTSIVAKDKRRYGLDFGLLDTKETTVEIEIPADFDIKYIPENVSAENPWLSFKAEYICKNRTLKFHQKLEVKRDTINQEEYPEFKNAFENLAKKVKQRMVLERIK